MIVRRSQSYRRLDEEVEILEDAYCAVRDYLSVEVRSFVPGGTFYNMVMAPRVRDRLFELLSKDVSKQLDTAFPLGVMKEFGTQLAIVSLRMRPDPICKAIDELASILCLFRLSYSGGENRRQEALWLAGVLLSSPKLDLPKLRTLIQCGEEMVERSTLADKSDTLLSESDHANLDATLNQLESLLLLTEIDDVREVEPAL